MEQSFNKEEIWGKQEQEKCSASLVISEMQIKVIKRCHYTPIRMPKTNKQNNSSTHCRKSCKETKSRSSASGSLTHYWLEWRAVQPLWLTIWQYLVKLIIQLLWLSNCIPRHLPQRNENLCSHTKKSVHKCFQPFYMKVSNWKPSGCFSVDEWLN